MARAFCALPRAVVALRKESVDRNLRWLTLARPFWVALRKESVDRNQMEANIIPIGVRSLSARRAWIEIRIGYKFADLVTVALRKESVDRNSTKLVNIRACISRSPQGERG